MVETWHATSLHLIVFLDFRQKLFDVDDIHNRKSDGFQYIEMMVFSTNDAYLRILETDAEVRTTDGAMDFTSYDWIFCTNKYYDTLVYHQVGDAKTFYAAPTQDYMDGERSAPLYDILDNLFTVGHTFFLDQLDNANFKDIIDIAENVRIQA